LAPGDIADELARRGVLTFARRALARGYAPAGWRRLRTDVIDSAPVEAGEALEHAPILAGKDQLFVACVSLAFVVRLQFNLIRCASPRSAEHPAIAAVPVLAGYANFPTATDRVSTPTRPVPRRPSAARDAERFAEAPK
jgi:hypothetical protein